MGKKRIKMAVNMLLILFVTFMINRPTFAYTSESQYNALIKSYNESMRSKIEFNEFNYEIEKLLLDENTINVKLKKKNKEYITLIRKNGIEFKLKSSQCARDLRMKVLEFDTTISETATSYRVYNQRLNLNEYWPKN